MEGIGGEISLRHYDSEQVALYLQQPHPDSATVDPQPVCRRLQSAALVHERRTLLPGLPHFLRLVLEEGQSEPGFEQSDQTVLFRQLGAVQSHGAAVTVQSLELLEREQSQKGQVKLLQQHRVQGSGECGRRLR